jgi:hypothetical protein
VIAGAIPGKEDEAISALRRALPGTKDPKKVCSQLVRLCALRKDYDGAWMAAQVVSGLIGEPGEDEREILTKLGPYAQRKEVAQRPLTDRLWQTHLLHPKVRGPFAELMGLLFEQVGHLYGAPFTHYQVVPKKHRIDVGSAQEYHVHHYRSVARLLGMETVELYSPFLVATRERLGKRSNEPVPEPLVNVEVLQTQPPCVRVGGKFFAEQGTREVHYLLGRALALVRPELAFSQRLSPERLEAVLQAALSLAVGPLRVTADPRAVDAERKLLEKHLPEPRARRWHGSRASTCPPPPPRTCASTWMAPSSPRCARASSPLASWSP